MRTARLLPILLAGLGAAVLAEEDSPPPDLEAEGWKPLFDGKSLEGWKVTPFAGHEAPFVEEGAIRIPAGLALSGIHLDGQPPKMDYEVTLEAKRIDGFDFFCCLTFPYAGSHCSFVVGGWGGGVVGISSVDGMDASENETADYMKFEKDRWYRISVRATPERIEAWIGGRQMVDLETEGRKISMRFGEIEDSRPLGIATWMTTGAVRDIRIRSLTPPE